jgi:hypothetical protein
MDTEDHSTQSYISSIKKMLISIFLVAFVGLSSAHLKVKYPASQQDGVLTERQASPYPANTIDMPVS